MSQPTRTHVDLDVCGVRINGMKLMTAQYKGKCNRSGQWYNPGTLIAFKHKDQLTENQKSVIFGTGTVYHLCVVMDDDKSSNESSVSKKMNPSKYQEIIFDKLINTQKHIFIEALAGCGKTSTLVWLVQELCNRGMLRGQNVLYLAFNKSIQEELTVKLQGTGCPAMTTHSFCFNQLLKPQFRGLSNPNNKNAVDSGKHRKLFHEILAVELYGNLSEMSLKKVKKADEYKARNAVCGNRGLVGFIKNWAIIPSWDANMEAYVFSKEQKEKIDTFIDEYEINIPYKDTPDASNGYQATLFERSEIVDWACAVASASIPRPGEDLNSIHYDDMLYLPLALGMSFPSYDLVLTDESQDFNEAQEQILLKLVAAKGRAIVVGDENQCCVEGTSVQTPNGLVKIEDIQKGDLVLSGKGLGELVYSKVSSVLSKYLDDDLVVEITTHSGKKITTTLDHTHFCSFKESVSDNYYIYLMYKENYGYRIGKTKNFRLRVNQERADSIWLIKSCKDEGEASYYEQFYSIKYGIPTWVFNYTDRNVAYRKDLVLKLFSEIDTVFNAEKLVKDLGFELSSPHHCSKSLGERTCNFTITLCGDNRQQPLHRFELSGLTKSQSDLLTGIGLKTKLDKNEGYYRFASSRANLGEIYDLIQQVRSVIAINVVEKARLSNQTLKFCNAGNVLPGMQIYIQDGNKVIIEEVVEVIKKKYSGKVYDINVERTHNFVANGILTHNCIYRFRGADSEAFKRIYEGLSFTERGAEKCMLPINYRSDTAIIEHAQRWVPTLEGRGAALGQKEGVVTNDKTYSEVLLEVNNDGSKEFAFLCRINVPLVVTAYQLMAQGKKVCIIGRNAIAAPMISIIEDLCGKKNRKGEPIDPELGGSYTDRLTDRRNEKNVVMEEGLISRLNAFCASRMARLQEEGHEQEIEALQNNVDCINIMASRVANDSVESVIEEINKLFVEDVDDQSVIKLSTVHRAKGLEFDWVGILRPELMPHPNAKPNADGSWSEDQQQEQNIQYVAATRAKHELHYVYDWPFGNNKRSKPQRTESKPVVADSVVLENLNVGQVEINMPVVFVDDNEPF